jgi:hypothetical protein
MNLSGFDDPEIQCRVPDGCCGPSPDDVTEESFICQIRALLPEGQIYNNTDFATDPLQVPQGNLGAIAICDNKIGCGGQLIFGGCCGDAIVCTDIPVAPQLAVVDSFASVAFGAVEALAVMLRELDPCTAKLTVRQWAKRYGIGHPDPCGEGWSESTLSLLICLLLRLRFEIRNWDFFTKLGHFFGAEMIVRDAGDMNCGPPGWWTMARDVGSCPALPPCPDEPYITQGMLVSLVPTCLGQALSLNIIMWPGDRTLPQNCNLRRVPSPQPHDPELYEVWKWLLPQLLPPNVHWCVYERDEANCII